MARSMRPVDMIEVSHLMTGLEGIHEVTVEFHVRTTTIPAFGSLDITLVAWVPSVEAHKTTEIATVKATWPERGQRDFVSYVFAQLYELDKAIGRHYAQKDLPE